MDSSFSRKFCTSLHKKAKRKLEQDLQETDDIQINLNDMGATEVVSHCVGHEEIEKTDLFNLSEDNNNGNDESANQDLPTEETNDLLDIFQLISEEDQQDIDEENQDDMSTEQIDDDEDECLPENFQYFDEEEDSLCDKIRRFALQYKLRTRAVRDLLGIFHSVGFTDLPKTSRTLLNTPQDTVEFKLVKPGNYYHVGLKRVAILQWNFLNYISGKNLLR